MAPRVFRDEGAYKAFMDKFNWGAGGDKQCSICGSIIKPVWKTRYDKELTYGYYYVPENLNLPKYAYGKIYCKSCFQTFLESNTKQYYNGYLMGEHDNKFTCDFCGERSNPPYKIPPLDNLFPSSKFEFPNPHFYKPYSFQNQYACGFCYGSLKTPEHFRDIAFDNLTINDLNRTYIQAFKDWSYKRNKRGIFLAGGVGIGKSLLFHLTAQKIYDSTLIVNKAGQVHNPSLVIKFKDILNEMSAAPFEEISSIINKYAYQNVLMLDDFGAEDFKTRLDDVINFFDIRYNNNLTTFVNSNFSIEEIAEKIDARVADRFVQMFESIFISKDRSHRTYNKK